MLANEFSESPLKSPLAADASTDKTEGRGQKGGECGNLNLDQPTQTMLGAGNRLTMRSTATP